MNKIIPHFLIRIIFIFNKVYASDEKLKIFYSGFSFSNNPEEYSYRFLPFVAISILGLSITF
jgi:hypothetical protein